MNGGTLKNLLTRCAAGTATACDDFFRQIEPLFRRLASRVARQYRRADDADDLAQEMCLKVSSAREKIAFTLSEDDVAARAYLSVVGVNAARDYFRGKGQPRITVPLDDGIRKFCDLTGFKSRLERDLLLDQIEAALPEGREATLFRLYYRQGFSAPEIAAIPALGLSVKATESIILRMGRRLKVQFEGSSTIKTYQ